MKKIIAVVVVLLLVLVVAPWGVGQVAEKRVNDGLDQLVKQAPYLTIVERKWTPGWFRSEQEVTFEAFAPWTRALTAKNVLGELQKATDASKMATESATPDASADSKVESTTDAPAEAPPAAGETADKPVIPPLRFTVRNEILHGPVLWPASLGIARINTKLVLSDEVRKTLTDIFGTDEPVRLSTRVHFFGGATTRLSGDGRTIQVKDKPTSISYDDYRLDVSYSSHLDHVDVDGKWPRLEFNDGVKNEVIEIKDVYLTGDTDRVQGDLYSGGVKFGVGEMRVVGADKAETRVEGIHYLVDTKVDGDFMEVQAKLGTGKMRNKELADLKFDVDEIHYDFSLRRLHIATLQKLVAGMKKMYTEPVTDPAALTRSYAKPFEEYGLELLRHDPEFVIDRIGIVTPEGEGVIKGVLKLEGVTEADFSKENTPGLMAKLNADLTVEIAQKLIEKIPNGNTGAGAAIDGGYARREGDKLVSHVEFRQSQLKINGKPQSLPGLGGPAGAQAPPIEADEVVPSPQE